MVNEKIVKFLTKTQENGYEQSDYHFPLNVLYGLYSSMLQESQEDLEIKENMKKDIIKMKKQLNLMNFQQNEIYQKWQNYYESQSNFVKNRKLQDQDDQKSLKTHPVTQQNYKEYYTQQQVQKEQGKYQITQFKIVQGDYDRIEEEKLLKQYSQQSYNENSNGQTTQQQKINKNSINRGD